MDSTSQKTSELSMGRPSDETLAEQIDEFNIKDLVVSSEFGRPDSRSAPSFHILENWVQRETERLRSIHISLSESSEALTVRAEVPGVKEEDLKVNVQPDCVLITRKPARLTVARSVHAGDCSDESDRIIELPNPVTVNKLRIAVRDGVLELDLAKAEPVKRELQKA